MRRSTTCKYMSTTPTASVLENKMGQNIRKESSADRAERTAASRTLAADCMDRDDDFQMAAPSVPVVGVGFGGKCDYDDDALVFGFDE